jgi:hypothetical protein
VHTKVQDDGGRTSRRALAALALALAVAIAGGLMRSNETHASPATASAQHSVVVAHAASGTTLKRSQARAAINDYNIFAADQVNGTGYKLSVGYPRRARPIRHRYYFSVREKWHWMQPGTGKRLRPTWAKLHIISDGCAHPRVAYLMTMPGSDPALPNTVTVILSKDKVVPGWPKYGC